MSLRRTSSNTIPMLPEFLPIFPKKPPPSRHTHHLWFRSVPQPFAQATLNQKLSFGCQITTHLHGSRIPILRFLPSTTHHQRHRAHPSIRTTSSHSHHRPDPIIRAQNETQVFFSTKFGFCLWSSSLLHFGPCRIHSTIFHTYSTITISYQQENQFNQRRSAGHLNPNQNYTIWETPASHPSHSHRLCAVSGQGLPGLTFRLPFCAACSSLCVHGW